MNDYIKAILALSISMEVKRVIADGIISVQPIYLFDIHVSATDNDYAYSRLYNGTSTSGIYVCDLNVVKKSSHNFRWFPPMYFAHGCYLDALGDFRSATFHFLKHTP